MGFERLFEIESITTDFLRTYLECVELGATPNFFSCLAETLRERKIKVECFQETRDLVLKRCREFFLGKSIVQDCRTLSMKKFDSGMNHIEAKKDAMAEMGIPEFFYGDVVQAMFPENIPRQPKLLKRPVENRGIHLIVSNRRRVDYKRQAGNDWD